MKKFILSGFLTFMAILMLVSLTLVLILPDNPGMRMILVALFSMIAGPYFSYEDIEENKEE